MNSAGQTVGLERSQQSSIFWPTTILGPRPGLREMNLACWGLFLAFILIPVCVVHWIQVKHGTGSVRQLNSDFVYFYGTGEIAHHDSATRIYDYDLQQQVFNAIYPPRDGVYSPSPYPPFVALFFLPFTYVSFSAAFLIWMVISLGLYLAGIAAAAKAAFPGARLKTSLIFCFALAFFPFLFGTLLNGQLATVAVFAVGLAIYQEKRGNLFWSGMALAILAYKPTLLLLLLPMLLLTRRFRALLGFITGAATLLLIATVFAGPGIWPVYHRMLQHFAKVSGVSGASNMQLWKYIDLNSSFAAIPGGKSHAGIAALACLIVISAIALAILLWKSAAHSYVVQLLAWSATLTWTLLLNVYVPIYDSVLVVIAVVLMLGAVHDLGWSRATEWASFLGVILFIASWKTESFANAHGIQLLTIALIALGIVQLVFLHRATRQSAASSLA